MADREDILWKQYELHVGLYKEYLNLTLKANVFYYAATGALLSFYFSKPNIAWMKYSLLLPLLMSVMLSLLFVYGAWKAKYTRRDLFNLRDAPRLSVAPEYAVLMVFLGISALLMAIVAIGLTVLIFFPCVLSARAT